MSEIKLDIPDISVLVQTNPEYKKVIVKPDSEYSVNIRLPRISTKVSGSFIQFAETALTSSYALTASYVQGGTISSASYALTASYAENAGGGTGVGFPFSGSAVITGSLLVIDGNGNFGPITGSLLGTASIAENITLIRAGNYETGSIQPVTPTSSGTTTFASSSISASYALTASYATNVVIIPIGTVSSSTQINTGSFSGSFTGTLIGTSSWANNVISASFATTASYALNAAGGGGGGSGAGFPFSGSAVITGSLLISGSGLRVTGSTDIVGNFTATTKSFLIEHQKLPGKKLIYGVLEGPEHAVFIRGKLHKQNLITLPEEWEWLVDPNTITVQLTPIGSHQKLFVKQIVGRYITVENDGLFTSDVSCYYLVHAERKDVSPLQTVI